MSTKTKILNALKAGKTLSRKQGERFFGNGFTQRIAELRTEGYPHIYTNKEKSGKYVYKLGAPTNEMKQAARKGELELVA